jgi:hypothetical protein
MWQTRSTGVMCKFAKVLHSVFFSFHHHSVSVEIPELIDFSCEIMQRPAAQIEQLFIIFDASRDSTTIKKRLVS